MPIYASWYGARVTEMVVNHRARQFGVSKYGINRVQGRRHAHGEVPRGLLHRPIYLFGGLGASSSWRRCSSCRVVVEKLYVDVLIFKMSLLLLSSFLATVAIVLMMMGLLAEIIVRTYHESNKPIYLVRDRLNSELVER